MSYSNDLTKELLDAGKRASDILNVYIVHMRWDDIKTRFVAIRLSDGGSDGVIYDNKRDAINHQLHEQQCAYVCFNELRAGASARDMAIYIKFNRDAYANGMRLTDPDDQLGGMQPLMTTGQRDFYRWSLGV